MTILEILAAAYLGAAALDALNVVTDMCRPGGDEGDAKIKGWFRSEPFHAVAIVGWFSVTWIWAIVVEVIRIRQEGGDAAEVMQAIRLSTLPAFVVIAVLLALL